MTGGKGRGGLVLCPGFRTGTSALPYPNQQLSSISIRGRCGRGFEGLDVNLPVSLILLAHVRVLCRRVIARYRRNFTLKGTS